MEQQEYSTKEKGKYRRQKEGRREKKPLGRLKANLSHFSNSKKQEKAGRVFEVTQKWHTKYFLVTLAHSLRTLVLISEQLKGFLRHLASLSV